MKKKKIPSVATSKEGVLYHEKKGNLKKQEAARKHEREEERKQKKEAKEKLLVLKEKSKKQRKKKALHKVYSETEDEEEDWMESGDSLDDVSLLGSSDNECDNILQNIEKGDYVTVSSPEKKCVINNFA
ncbi:hypothetical protein PR048_001232 [Dryococelus australis]|uniref:Uncharacterized protein n=1 Tax=Dryococelus australis TaxID=614101 RepID=A0ABQ9IGT9_9NEOP|nr:hypothetical protein PR048_001232 [Dryococelus australis]